jgi:aspartate aminotransferase
VSSLLLSDRALEIKPSPTLAVTSKAAQLKAQGLDIVSLGAGEPDFDTPDFIKDAAIKAIQQGQTKYTAVGGTPELKAAVIEKFKRDNQLDFKPSEILVSCGGKHSFFNLSLAVLNAGDEAIIPAPYWVSYPDMVQIAGGKPVIIKTDASQAFKITPQQLTDAITDKTRLVVINSPSNPTGKNYTRAELKALADVLLKHPQILIASDDMYEAISWAAEPFANMLMVCPELRERFFVLNGVSKAYAMTGWRIGYMAGPARYIEAMTDIQSQSTSNPCSISQAAATAALSGDQNCLKPMLKAFKERHDYFLKALNQLPSVSCLEADGAFYLFPDFNQVIKNLDGIDNDIQLGEFFLEKAGVALVPGSAFGAPGYMRISFATSMQNLEKAFERLNQTLNQYL